ncbi:Epididymal secretory protein E1 [Paragonimus heterotremus]|uniref:Epididymal secretory protein E1 n=1 Tax=Paragonimus heterotremus TaxID=100268 RepID=A0A8J4WZQ9_9TREM|nr:Epididymal secretory protein E1 [Paragonimus heterotremus]
MLWVLFFLLFSSYVRGTSNPAYRDCGSKSGMVVSLEVIPCEEHVCTLHKGTNSTIVLKFRTKDVVQHGTVVVHGILAHVPIHFPLDDATICSFLSPPCPMLPTQDSYTYTFSLPISHSYPSVRLTIRWELVDDHNTDIACVEFPAQIEA